MFSKKIVFHNQKEVCAFVHEAEKCEFDIDISHNHTFVDAKSILGVIGFGLSKVLTVTYPKKNQYFENTLKNFEVV